MPSSYTSSSYIARTYGRKSLTKRRTTFDDIPNEETDVSQVQPRKRRKVSDARESTTPVKEKEKSQESPKESQRSSTPPPTRKIGSVSITYGSPKRKPKSSSPPPRTPQRVPVPARDLSSIFESLTPTKSSPSPSPPKLAKRMLARSKTDSSIDTQPGTSNILFGNFERTPSLPNLPSSPSRNNNLPSHQDPLPSLPPPVPAPVTTRTYAGKSRSFLVAIPTSNLAGSNPLLGGGAEEQEDEYSARESYSSLRTRWGVDNSEDDPYPPYPAASPSRSDTISTPTRPSKKSVKGKGKGGATKEGQPLIQALPLPNGMMNPLKSMTELRNKGESRRFLDEIGYLFEGMEPSGGIGLRRASALEITTKLCDAEFSRKAKAVDFFGRIWDVFGEAGAGRGEDKILDTLLAFFLALVARDPASLVDLETTSTSALPNPTSSASRKGLTLVDTLFGLLSHPVDPLALSSVSPKEAGADQGAEFKKMGISKKDRGLFTTIYMTIATQSSLFSIGTHISTPLLVTHALQILPPSMLPTQYFPEVLISLRKTLSSVIAPSSSYLSWPDAAYAIPYENVYNHLRLLDTYLLGQWTDLALSTDVKPGDTIDVEERDTQNANNKILAQAREEWLAEALVALSVCAELNDGRAARKCAESSFRVLVSLTHADETWATTIVANECVLPFLARVIAHSSERIKRGPRTELKIKEEMVKKEEAEVEEVVSSEEDSEGDEQTRSLDQLCLALGLLTNLVQGVESVKVLLRDIRLDPTCSLKKRTCIHRCACNNAKSSLSILDILVRLYVAQLPPVQTFKSESTPPTDTADASFLRGHLAVVFGLLMRGSSDNQKHILALLDGTGVGVSSRAKLNRLVDQAQDFVTFYAAWGSHSVEPDLIPNSDEPDERGRELDIERKRESEVARDVVRFLEKLRDDVEN